MGGCGWPHSALLCCGLLVGPVASPPTMARGSNRAQPPLEVGDRGHRAWVAWMGMGRGWLAVAEHPAVSLDLATETPLCWGLEEGGVAGQVGHRTRAHRGTTEGTFFKGPLEISK